MKKIFKKLGVDIIYLFGSHAQGEAHKKSDVDIGVVFQQPAKYKNNLRAYHQLYDILVEVLPKKYLKERILARAHEFDLVFLQFAPLELQFNAVSKGKVLFAVNPQKEAYRQQVCQRYIDLSYLLRIRQKAVLERI